MSGDRATTKSVFIRNGQSTVTDQCFSWSQPRSSVDTKVRDPLPNSIVRSRTDAYRPMHSSTGSDHSSRSSEAKLFGVEFSNFHVSKEDSVRPRRHRLEAQLFEAEYLADEYSCLVPANVSAVVHPSQKKSLGVVELRQLARESDGSGLVETRWNSVACIKRAAMYLRNA